MFALCRACTPQQEDDEEVAVAPSRGPTLLTSARARWGAGSGAVAADAAKAKEANPPRWPPSVHVVEPDGAFSGDKQALFDSIFADGGKYSVHPWGGTDPNARGYGGYFDETGRDFSRQRTAVLLKPGAHDAKFNVGFYNSLIGLGRAPGDVRLGAFECLNGVGPDRTQHGPDPGALNNFWRSVENLQTASGRDIHWYVSQAAPLRRVHIQGQLRLTGPVGGGVDETGYASGGFLADSQVDGGLDFGGQQQWFARNTAVPQGEAYQHGAWSVVLVGGDGEYKREPGQSGRVTEVPLTERIAEKPYIVFDEGRGGRYLLRVPWADTGTHGPSWGGQCEEIDFEEVYVAEAGPSFSASEVNAKLAQGKHVVFTPGIYAVREPIVISHSNTVVLGMGMATLEVADSAQFMDALLLVRDGLVGVRVAGLMLQAGPNGSGALLQWGTATGAAGPNPGFVQDLFCRVGGDRDSAEVQVSTHSMVRINTSGVVGDNLWLWRADHEVPSNEGVTDSRNEVFHGLEVNGDDVIMYGLFCEHSLRDQTVWNGENGKTFFYQCELPYDVTQANFGDLGYAGYAVGAHVASHSLEGAGVYSYFRDYDVRVRSGFKAPGVRLHHANLFTVFLNGKGGIDSVLDGRGPASSGAVQGQPCFL